MEVLFFCFCVCVLDQCVCFVCAASFVMPGFSRSLLSRTGQSLTIIILNNRRITKAAANKTESHRQGTQTQKQGHKYDLTGGTLSTVPETQFQETCDRESITLPMSFGLNWTKRGSAVHCELPYFKIVSKHNQPWWTKVKAPPWPLAQPPSTVLLIK